MEFIKTHTTFMFSRTIKWNLSVKSLTLKKSFDKLNIVVKKPLPYQNQWTKTL